MSPEKIPTRLALAQKMRFLRFTRGWSQEVLAELAGLHRTRSSGVRSAPLLCILHPRAALGRPGRSCASCASCARDISASLHVNLRDIRASCPAH